jgi:murein DD-endopeptidase MepM/ murein hydrolase activator NlpD
MSHAHNRSSGGKKPAPSNGPHHVIIARGEAIRSFAIRPLSVVLAGIIVIGVVSGSLSVAALAIFKNDTQITAVAEQNRIRQQYELQMADLHRQMDALVSRQLVERELLNNQVAGLLDRQGQLIEQQQLLTGLATDALAAGIDVLPMLAPLPRANPLRATEVEGGIGGPIDPVTTGATEIGPQAAVSHSDALAAVEMTADWVAETQLDALALLADAIADRTDELASLLRQLGYSPAGDAVGGPFVPAFGAEEIDLVTDELADLEDLQAFARALPLARPLAQLEVTSSFGRRLDPFLGESAVHTGVDFRAASGTSVLATGPGIVTEADVNGGYGKMVEVDHGNGITTRYAHLSSILVNIGDTVTTGMIVGRAGSTGRSTGPHLHYEIRRNDTPFDPMPHLRTGPQIVDLL